MDPLTLIVAAVVSGWVVGAPDQGTLRATRGTVGAGRAVVHGTRGYMQSAWATGGPARARKRTRRRAKWRDHPIGVFALLAEWTAIYAWRATRTTARAVRAGLAQAPAGYRAAGQAAVDRRAERGPGPVRRWAMDHLDRSGPVQDDTGPEPVRDDRPGGPADNEKENTVDQVQVKETDLETVDDLRGEAESWMSMTEELGCQLSDLGKWATGLADRMGGAKWSTGGVQSASGAVAETGVGDMAKVLEVFAEALAALVKACSEAGQVGEAADAVDAQGDLAAFRAS